MQPAIKFVAGASNVLDILAIPFGGPFNGKDTDGEYFSAKTELCLDWYGSTIPLLYHHGLDSSTGVIPVGRVDLTTARKEVDGWWVQAQLDESNKYFDSISQLVAEGKLYGSSGAMPHLVRRAKHGEILVWPWVENSLTPTPANLFSLVNPTDVAKHYKSAGLTFAQKGEAIPAQGDNGDAPEGSYEDLLQDLNRALNAGSMFGGSPFGDAYCYTVATFPDHAIVRVCSYEMGEGEEAQYYRVEYTMGADGEPVLGAAAPYDLAYIPALAESAEPGDMALGKSGTALDATPLVLAAEQAHKLATVVVARTKDVQLRRVKAGRVLSTANKQRLQALLDAMKAAQSDLEELLTSTDPPAKAASADVLRLLELRHRTMRQRKESTG